MRNFFSPRAHRPGREPRGRCRLIRPERPARASWIREASQAFHAVKMRNHGSAAQRATPPGAAAAGVGRAERAGPHGSHQRDGLRHIGISRRPMAGSRRRRCCRICGRRGSRTDVPDLDLIGRVFGGPGAERSPAEASLGRGATVAGCAHGFRFSVFGPDPPSSLKTEESGGDHDRAAHGVARGVARSGGGGA